MVMLESDGFFDFAGLEALDTYADPFGRAVHDGPNGLQVRHKTPYIDTGGL